ncbi:MAG TPA: DoxX family protein [Candidatus Acidoferrales bacterium]|nr:DoxX family protein [Candidatus Acidoferrales bacterium]
MFYRVDYLLGVIFAGFIAGARLSRWCIAAGVAFILAGYAKALYTSGMVEFFTQSGYSAGFLKFIMTAEILGGIGMLIPWTVLPAVAGLSIDMFGAIWTHVHNGDPLNDSTGAIGQLLRLAAIVALWAWQRRPAETSGAVRRRLTAALAGGVLCAAIAVGGSAAMRHVSGPVTQQPAHPAKTS